MVEDPATADEQAAAPKREKRKTVIDKLLEEFEAADKARRSSSPPGGRPRSSTDSPSPTEPMMVRAMADRRRTTHIGDHTDVEFFKHIIQKHGIGDSSDSDDDDAAKGGKKGGSATAADDGAAAAAKKETKKIQVGVRIRPSKKGDATSVAADGQQRAGAWLFNRDSVMEVPRPSGDGIHLRSASTIACLHIGT